MTREEQLLQEHDPEFLKKRKRERLWLRGALCLGVLAVIVGSLAIAGYFKNESRVTKIERYVCAKDPGSPSDECEAIRQALARNESIKAHCIAHQRVEGSKGRFCPQWFVPRPGEPAIADADAVPPPTGGDALQSGPTGSQQPGPRGGGDGSGNVGAGRGGSDDPSAPPSTGSDPAPETDAPSNPNAPSVPDQFSPPKGPPAQAPPSTTGPVEDVTSTAADAVEQAGKDVEGAVGKTTEGAGKAVDCALRGGC